MYVLNLFVVTVLMCQNVLNEASPHEDSLHTALKPPRSASNSLALLVLLLKLYSVANTTGLPLTTILRVANSELRLLKAKPKLNGVTRLIGNKFSLAGAALLLAAAKGNKSKTGLSASESETKASIMRAGTLLAGVEKLISRPNLDSTKSNTQSIFHSFASTTPMDADDRLVTPKPHKYQKTTNHRLPEETTWVNHNSPTFKENQSLDKNETLFANESTQSSTCGLTAIETENKHEDAKTVFTTTDNLIITPTATTEEFKPTRERLIFSTKIRKPVEPTRTDLLEESVTLNSSSTEATLLRNAPTATVTESQSEAGIQLVVSEKTKIPDGVVDKELPLTVVGLPEPKTK